MHTVLSPDLVLVQRLYNIPFQLPAPLLINKYKSSSIETAKSFTHTQILLLLHLKHLRPGLNILLFRVKCAMGSRRERYDDR